MLKERWTVYVLLSLVVMTKPCKASVKDTDNAHDRPHCRFNSNWSFYQTALTHRVHNTPLFTLFTAYALFLTVLSPILC